MGFLHAEVLRNPDSEKDVSWLFTLAVHTDTDHASFSLMKDGGLAFDVWGEGTPLEEHLIELSLEDFLSLKQEFGVRFEAARELTAGASGEGLSYTFEHVEDTVTTLNFSGVHPDMEAFVHRLSKLAEKSMPDTITVTAPEAKPVFFEIDVTPRGVSVGGETVSIPDLETRLAGLSSDTKVLIRADAAVRHQDVMTVIERCAEAGLKVALTATSSASGADDEG
jgi:biopolymer transport protein ExbD